MKVVRSIWGRLGNPGRIKTRDEPDREPSAWSGGREESVEAAAMKLGKPSDAVSAVRLSCFLSYCRGDQSNPKRREE